MDNKACGREKVKEWGEVRDEKIHTQHGYVESVSCEANTNSAYSLACRTVRYGARWQELPGIPNTATTMFYCRPQQAVGHPTAGPSIKLGSHQFYQQDGNTLSSKQEGVIGQNTVQPTASTVTLTTDYYQQTYVT